MRTKIKFNLFAVSSILVFSLCCSTKDEPSSPLSGSSSPSDRPQAPLSTPPPSPNPTSSASLDNGTTSEGLISYELSDQESKDYPIRELFANKILTGNLLDPKTGQLRGTQEDANKLHEFTEAADKIDGGPKKDRFDASEKRILFVKDYIRIVGEPRARKFGLIFYDNDGRAKYVWPHP